MANCIEVALVTDSDVFAGTERHMLDLAVALREADQNVAVTMICPKPSPLAERSEQVNLPVIVISPSRTSQLVDLSTVRVLRRLLKTNRVQILHVHNSRTALHAVLAKVLARRGEIIVTQHCLDRAHTAHGGIKTKFFAAVHRWVNRNVTQFIAISRAVQERLVDYDASLRDRITTILHSLPAPDASTLAPRETVRGELGINDSTALVVAASRLEKEKDVATLIAAMAKLKATGTDARCIIAGEGAERPVLEAQIEAINVADCVRLLGFRSDALALIRAADVLVLPSSVEGFGLVILEAMALGKPVVVTDAGGPREVVANRETGMVVPPRDPQAMADALGKILSNFELQEQMGQAGRRRYENQFRPERMARAVTDVYQRVLAS